MFQNFDLTNDLIKAMIHNSDINGYLKNKNSDPHSHVLTHQFPLGGFNDL